MERKKAIPRRGEPSGKGEGRHYKEEKPQIITQKKKKKSQ